MDGWKAGRKRHYAGHLYWDAASPPNGGGRRTLVHMPRRPPSWKYDYISEIRLRQSMHIYSKNNPAKFHPILVEMTQPQQQQQEKTTTRWERYGISSWSNKTNIIV